MNTGGLETCLQTRILIPNKALFKLTLLLLLLLSSSSSSLLLLLLSGPGFRWHKNIVKMVNKMT